VFPKPSLVPDLTMLPLVLYNVLVTKLNEGWSGVDLPLGAGSGAAFGRATASVVSSERYIEILIVVVIDVPEV
jgi:hypothetical protein